jgi:preprotein translocase subunit SecA
MENLLDGLVGMYCKESPHAENWDWPSLTAYVDSLFGRLVLPDGTFASILTRDKVDLERFNSEELKELISEHAHLSYEHQEESFGGDVMRELERRVLLKVVDEKWMDHIDSMEQLKLGIGLRAYGQNDPVVAYKREGFDMFDEMIKNVQEDTVKTLLRLRQENVSVKREQVAEPIAASHGDDTPKQPKKREITKVGRNNPCPCGSGKKYKNCHGA